MSILYPLEREEAGQSSWKINHHLASLYPIENPNDKQKERMKTTILTNMTAVSNLCKNCKMDIKKYLRDNPIEPALVGRKALSLYLCNFHNFVKKKTGKPLEVENCETILRDIPVCKDCAIKQEEEGEKIAEKKTIEDNNTNTKTEKGSEELKESFQHFKTATVKVFEALCKKYNLPVPNFKFHQCPNNSEVSCTRMLVDKNTNKVLEKPTVYFHPNVYGLRTIPHEFVHYAKQMFGDAQGTLDEYEVERLTQEILFKEFPYDEFDVNKKPEGRWTKKEKEEYVTPLVVKDNVPVNIVSEPNSNPNIPKHLAKFPLAAKFYEKYGLSKVAARKYRPDFNNGDLILDFFKKKEEASTINTDALGEEVHNIEKDFKNVFSFIDGLYKPFGDILGMKPADLNLAHTPNILAGSILTLIKTNMTPLGSMIFSVLTSLGLFGALALNKHHITYGDRRFMNAMGSLFFWDSLEYINPKLRGDIVEGALQFGEIIATQSFSEIPGLLVDSPYLSAMSGYVNVNQGQDEVYAYDTDSPSVASPLSSTRISQRSAGMGGSRSGVGGRTATAAGRGSTQTLSLQQRRELERQKGKGGVSKVAMPEKDVRTGAGGGNPSMGLLPKDKNTINMYADMEDEEDGIVVPSDEMEMEEEAIMQPYEDENESSFGIRVADGKPRTAFDYEDGDSDYDEPNIVYYPADEDVGGYY